MGKKNVSVKTEAFFVFNKKSRSSLRFKNLRRSRFVARFFSRRYRRVARIPGRSLYALFRKVSTSPLPFCGKSDRLLLLFFPFLPSFRVFLFLPVFRLIIQYSVKIALCQPYALVHVILNTRKCKIC